MEQSERPRWGPSEAVQEGDTAYILTLDEGLLHKVFSCLAVNDLLSAQCTCRQLNSFIARDQELWRSLFIPNRWGGTLEQACISVQATRLLPLRVAYLLLGLRPVALTGELRLVLCLVSPRRESRGLNVASRCCLYCVLRVAASQRS